MGALPKFDPGAAGIAEVTVIDGRQAVLLPENVHLDAARLKVVQHGSSLSLSPAPRPLTAEQIEQVLADLDTLQREAGNFMPDGREQPSMPEGDDIEL